MSNGAVKFESGNGSRPVFGRKAAFAGCKPEDRELIKTTLEAMDEWLESNRNFNQVYEDMLVDYYTYRIKACEARYAYYLKQVKEKGLSRYLQIHTHQA